jgi:hypothetical protein
MSGELNVGKKTLMTVMSRVGLPQSRQTVTPSPNEGETRYTSSTNRSGQLHILRWRDL